MSDQFMQQLSNAMYGCPTKLSDNMAVDGFLLIIFANLKFPLSLASFYLMYVKKLQTLKNIRIQVHLKYSNTSPFMLSFISSRKCNEN